MTNREKDIQRYLRGEMTPAEQHALEKAALNDPFLAEALEGLSNLTEAELTDDLESISAELESQTEHVWQMPAAAPMRKVAQTETSLMADESEHPVQTPAVKSKNKWMWPLRIAALLLIVLGGYLIVPRLFNNPKNDLALQQDITKTEEAPIAALTDTTSSEEIPMEEEAMVSAKPAGQVKDKLASKSITGQVKKDSVTNPVLGELEEPLAVVTVTEQPLALEQPTVKLKDETDALKKEAQPELHTRAMASQNIIYGKVVAEEDQTPLPGVNILIKGTTIGVVTDINGRYQIESNLPSVTLLYSFIGLQTKEITVKQPGELNVELKTDVSQLSEVVVTGYSVGGADPNHEPVIKLAQPAGGLRAYDKYLKNSLRYPQQALENNVKGRVTVSFTVFTDGRVAEFNVLKSLGFGCDEEVIRLVKDGPKWSPTTQDGEPVESEVRVRVKFAPPSR